MEKEQVLHIHRKDFIKVRENAVTFLFCVSCRFLYRIYRKFSEAMSLQSSEMCHVYFPYFSYSFFLWPCSEESAYLTSFSPCSSPSLLPSHYFSLLISYLIGVHNISVSTKELHKDWGARLMNQ